MTMGSGILMFSSILTDMSYVSLPLSPSFLVAAHGSGHTAVPYRCTPKALCLGETIPKVCLPVTLHPRLIWNYYVFRAALSFFFFLPGSKFLGNADQAQSTGNYNSIIHNKYSSLKWDKCLELSVNEMLFIDRITSVSLCYCPKTSR